MAYNPQTWNDNDSTTPLSAARMSYIENGLQTAAAVADQALANGGGGGGSGLTTFGSTNLSSWSGSTDDAKLTAALNYAAAQSKIPAIIIDYNASFSQGGRTPFTGLKLYGPLVGARGQMNLEISSGAPVNHKITLSCGSGTSSWWYGTGTYYDIHVVGLAFQDNNSSQFWHQPSGTIYACTFDNLTFYGFASVFGNNSNAALITAVNMRGLWEVLGFTNTASPQFSFGGSDSVLWMDGELNLQCGGSAPNANAMPLMRYNSLQKTNVAYQYLTATNGYIGLQVMGASDVKLFGGTYEGFKSNSPSIQAVLDVQGGVVKVFGTDFNYTFTANGTITQSGGKLIMFAPTNIKADSADATYPFVYQTGGRAEIYSPISRDGLSMRFRKADGTTQDYPYAPTGLAVQ